mmetsp:Transcript_28353/g.68972  ORF Transcript_28353/g.68972 Transcript_28353/m.68972 type:complete len:133 (+) Transcript_28353:2297-2695(+)
MAPKETTDTISRAVKQKELEATWQDPLHRGRDEISLRLPMPMTVHRDTERTPPPMSLLVTITTRSTAVPFTKRIRKVLHQDGGFDQDHSLSRATGKQGISLSLFREHILSAHPLSSLKGELLVSCDILWLSL